MKSASSSSSWPREVQDLRAAFLVGPEPLLLAVAVLADDRRRRVEDDLRRAVVPLEADDRRPRGSRARSRGCSSGRRRATCRSTGPGRRRRRCCGGARPAAAPAGTAGGWCPGTRPPSRSGTGARSARGRSRPSPPAPPSSAAGRRSRARCSRAARRGSTRRSCRSACRAGSSPTRTISGPCIVFFAWLIRDSAARGCTSVSSMFSSFSACLTTDS